MTGPAWMDYIGTTEDCLGNEGCIVTTDYTDNTTQDSYETTDRWTGSDYGWANTTNTTYSFEGSSSLFAPNRPIGAIVSFTEAEPGPYPEYPNYYYTNWSNPDTETSSEIVEGVRVISYSFGEAWVNSVEPFSHLTYELNVNLTSASGGNYPTISGIQFQFCYT